MIILSLYFIQIHFNYLPQYLYEYMHVCLLRLKSVLGTKSFSSQAIGQFKIDLSVGQPVSVLLTNRMKKGKYADCRVLIHYVPMVIQGTPGKPLLVKIGQIQI